MIKKLHFLFFLMLINNMMTAQEWIQKNDFSGIERFSAAGAAIGNMAYLGMGRAAGENGAYRVADFWEWNMLTDTWTQKQEYPGAGQEACSMFAIGNKLYAGMGSNGDDYKNDLWEWDPDTEIWTPKTSIPEGRAGASVFIINNKAYLFAGSINGNSSGSSTLWEYNPETDNWSQMANCPAAAQFEMPAFTIGLKAYVFAGNTDLWEWDSTTNLWTDKTNVPETMVIQSSGFSINDIGYLVNTGNSRDHLWKYDQPTDSWIQLPNAPNGALHLTASFVVGPSAYMATGYNDNGEGDHIEKTVWQFTPENLGVPENENLRAGLSPNPFNNQLVLHLPKANNATAVFTNALGQQVKKTYCSGYDTIINVEDLPSGLYIVNITADNQSTVLKVLKR